MTYDKFIILFLCPFVASLDTLDTQISDDLDTKLSSQLYAEQQFFDTGDDTDQDARHKRSPKYVVLESHGLKSHFRSKGELRNVQSDDDVAFKNFDKTNEFMQNIAYDKLHPPKQDAEVENFRLPRSIEPEHRSVEMSTPGAVQTPEKLPQAEAQVMDDYHPERRNQPMPMDRWTKSPFDYSKVHNEEDSLAEATSVNEGIKARTPRVNFITQQKSSKSENPNDSDQKSSATKPEIYRSQPSAKPIEDRYYRRDYDELPYYRDSDPYSRRYDRYSRYERDDMFNYNPYPMDYSRSFDVYDRYMPKEPAYPDHYYDYPDSRYDLPEPRDYRPLYSNDISDRGDRYPYHPYQMPPPATNRNRRIIYYATLPEIVRTPPSVDLRYKSYNNRYDDLYDNYAYYNRDMEINRNRPAYLPNAGALKDERTSQMKIKEKPGIVDAPVRVSGSLTVKDPNSRLIYSGRHGEDMNSYY
ncbi:uncharacterized protein LOC119077587 [Bradysia coprophila]|uniref:uncharacterized protein LOC119077587 n=1 Tax=Bradysia coprophila TaxID=38358 RepID=UPI00187DCC79|nr:uncharacterized protein LOC119077587 [Bradysia coprophila]